VADFPEAWLWIELEISTEFKPSNELAETVGQPMRQAFASYASADLPDVLARISAITAWDKGLDIFYSWLDLIEGEDWESRLKKELSLREVLLLFWSRNAKASKWVDWEWRTVLRMRGLKAIQPMPIEPPEIAAPPEELAPHMNFRDRYLIAREAALRIAELKAEAKRN
jgi:TIR domain